MKRSFKKSTLIFSIVALLLSSTIASAWITYTKSFSIDTIKPSPGNPLTMRIYEYQNSDSTYAWNNYNTGDKLDFGKIDNIARLKPENTIFLEIKIPEKAGKSIFYSTAFDSVEIQKDSNPLQVEIDSGLTYIESYYSLQDSALSDPSEGISDWQLCENSSLENLSIDSFNNGYKYFYIKIQPDLPSYLKIVDSISQYMPCDIVFKNLTANFEVR